MNGFRQNCLSRLPRIMPGALVTLWVTLIAFNNLTDYGSNLVFVRHVLAMDTTFPQNHGMWRALHGAGLAYCAYDLIILWECAVAASGWVGLGFMLRAIQQDGTRFAQSCRISALSLALGLVLWIGGFLAIGGEWFLMWQSQLWNGQQAAFRLACLTGIALLLLPVTEL